MNKLSANGYKGINFLTSLIEIKHMIIYSRSPCVASPRLPIGGRTTHTGRHWPTGFAAANQRAPPARFYLGGGLCVTWRQRSAPDWLAAL